TAVQHQHAGPAVRRKVAVEDGGGAVVEHQAVIGVPRGRAPVNAPVGALEENDSDSTDDPAAARADGAVAERGAASPLNRDAVPPARDRQPVEQKAVPRDRDRVRVWVRSANRRPWLTEQPDVIAADGHALVARPDDGDGQHASGVRERVADRLASATIDGQLERADRGRLPIGHALAQRLQLTPQLGERDAGALAPDVSRRQNAKNKEHHDGAQRTIPRCESLHRAPPVCRSPITRGFAALFLQFVTRTDSDSYIC